MYINSGIDAAAWYGIRTKNPFLVGSREHALFERGRDIFIQKKSSNPNKSVDEILSTPHTMTI